jgi:glycosyltransferase involved in cell wall biosynthesis
MDGRGVRVGILGYSLDITGGESRQIVNFARGLKRLGASPVIFVLAATAEVRTHAGLEQLEIHSVCESLGRFELAQAMGFSGRLSGRLRRLVDSAPRCDFYVIAQDAALGVVGEHLPGKVVEYCCGDLSLLLLDRGFRRAKGRATDLLSLGLVRQLERHARWANACDRRLANSRFTSGLMSYLYDAHFDKVIYPPVDTDFFTPKPRPDSVGGFALAILRSSVEPAFGLVEQLSKTLPVVVVGGASVSGARNLGRVTDAELAGLYSRANLTLSPSLREFFGYPIVESMACGTPSLAFAQGGALEIIQEGQNGWLRTDEQSFLDAAATFVGSGPTDVMRARARSDSRAFSIDTSSKALLELLT